MPDIKIEDNPSTPGSPLHVSDDDFQRLVLESPLPVVVDFYATWCPPCRRLSPILDKLAKEFAGRLVVAKVNVDDNGKYASEYDVRGIPCLLFICNGNISERVVGTQPYVELRQLFEKLAAGCPGQPQADDAQAEKLFQSALLAAQSTFEATVAPALDELRQASAPHIEAREHAEQAAQADLNAGKITPEQHQEAVNRAREALTEAIRPYRDAYLAVSQPAEEAYQAAVRAATDAFAARLKN